MYTSTLNEQEPKAKCKFSEHGVTEEQIANTSETKGSG